MMAMAFPEGKGVDGPLRRPGEPQSCDRGVELTTSHPFSATSRLCNSPVDFTRIPRFSYAFVRCSASHRALEPACSHLNQPGKNSTMRILSRCVLVATVGLLSCGNAGGDVALADENFCIENKVFIGSEKTPASESITIFHDGIVYDYLK